MSALVYRRVYRAHVQAAAGACEITVYVEAGSHEGAIRKISAAIEASQPLRKDVRDAIYNCSSAAECVEQGASTDLELRLFEVGWGGGRGPLMCRDPVFLVENPGAWAAKWAAARATEPPVGETP
ncbi:MAG TPA: hypothetical protein VE907_19640 [Gammaproteobacteria bacterium]|nr:hypothetical protein [Gammaproteobacteria bacterium]